MCGCDASKPVADLLAEAGLDAHSITMVAIMPARDEDAE